MKMMEYESMYVEINWVDKDFNPKVQQNASAQVCGLGYIGYHKSTGDPTSYLRLQVALVPLFSVIQPLRNQ